MNDRSIFLVKEAISATECNKEIKRMKNLLKKTPDAIGGACIPKSKEK